jgi:hypothetical protein
MATSGKTDESWRTPSRLDEIQDTEPFLRLLRARFQIYRRAERLQLAQLAVMVVAPVIAALIATLSEGLRPYAAGATAFLTMLDVCVIDRRYRRLLQEGAKCAEEFDTQLFQLPWSRPAAGRKLDPEYVRQSARGWTRGDERLPSWYPKAAGEAPLPIARLLCQRTNVWYDGELRRSYSGYLLLVAILVPALLFAGGAIAGLTAAELLISALVPATPVVVWAMRERFRQMDAAEANDSVKGEAEAVLTSVAAGELQPEHCTGQARQLQSAIYGRRAANPLLFPFIYDRLRPDMEKSMNEGAEEWIERLRPKL